MYETVVEITKETWGKCSIKTVRHYNEKQNITELWQKVSNVETQIKHSNIWDVALKRTKIIMAKRPKNVTQEEKQKYKAYFEGETGIFIIKKLTRDITERCKLPEAMELRKKLGYNHDDIMAHEETSIAEKILELFPDENILLNKNFNGRKPDIWFKDYDCTVEVDAGNHENYDSDDEKEKEGMFKRHNLKTFRCNLSDPDFDLFKFVGKINVHISKYARKKSSE